MYSSNPSTMNRIRLKASFLAEFNGLEFSVFFLLHRVLKPSPTTYPLQKREELDLNLSHGY